MCKRFALGLLFCVCLVTRLQAQSVSPPEAVVPSFDQMDRSDLMDQASFHKTKNLFRQWTDIDNRSREFRAIGDDLSWRLRRTTRREQALPGFDGVRLVVWDEDHFDSRDRGWGPETSFEQNRTFAGLNWGLNPSNSSHFEFGYLNQTWDEPGRDDRRFHFLSINFNY